MASIDERGSTCCYAKQDKFWVQDAPSGERWDVYTVVGDSDSDTLAGEADPAACRCC